MIAALLLAAAEAGALPPVVVTGGLRNAPLLDVPSAVGVLDAEALARSGPGAQPGIARAGRHC